MIVDGAFSYLKSFSSISPSAGNASARTLALATIAAALVIAASPRLSAQRTARTPNGRPDLQGIWLNNTATPLERLKDFADRAFFNEEEAREYEKHYLLDRAVAANIDNPFELAVGADVDAMEPGHVLRNRRTSLIVDPPDGRIPALTPEGRRRLIEQAQQLKPYSAENPEELRLGERCLMIAGSPVGPPMLPVFYNNNIQIVQTEHDVMILTEMIHDARVISLDRRAHLPAKLRQWKGDSIGRWQGDALIVDTTNFTDKTTLRGSGSELHVVERFALTDANTLTYQFTIDDPASFVRRGPRRARCRRPTGRCSITRVTRRTTR